MLLIKHTGRLIRMDEDTPKTLRAELVQCVHHHGGFPLSANYFCRSFAEELHDATSASTMDLELVKSITNMLSMAQASAFLETVREIIRRIGGDCKMLRANIDNGGPEIDVDERLARYGPGYDTLQYYAVNLARHFLPGDHFLIREEIEEAICLMDEWKPLLDGQEARMH